MDREAELIARAAAGDRGAFDELIAARWPRLARLAARIVGSAAEGQDVAQQACLRAWRAAGRIEGGGEGLDRWLARATANLAVDALRRRKARPEDPAGEELAARTAAATPDPEQAALAAELEAALQRVAADLPPRQKALFVLTRVEGYSAADAAAMLGIAPSTARNTLFQLRATLARRLGEHFTVEPRLLHGDDRHKP